MRVGLLCIRIVVGSIFVVASYSKLRYPMVFAYSLAEYQLLPENLVSIVAITVPWVELLLGISLLSGTAIRASGRVATILFVLFALMTASTLVRGLTVNCGCYMGWSLADWYHVVLNILLGGLSYILATARVDHPPESA